MEADYRGRVPGKPLLIARVATGDARFSSKPMREPDKERERERAFRYLPSVVVVVVVVVALVYLNDTDTLTERQTKTTKFP